MRAKIVFAAAGLLCLLAACKEGGTAGSAQANPQAGAASDSTSTAESSSAAPAGGQCPVGNWEVTTITGKSGATVNGVPVVAKSGGGFTLAIGADGKWTLTGTNASVTLEAAGLSVAATVNGTAEGDYAKTGSNYTFRQQRATGKVTLKQAVGGVSSWPMDQVGPALAPGGQATLTCGAGTLELSSESVVLALKGTGGGGAPQQSEPTTGGGSSGGGGTLTLVESAQTRTIDCAGRTVDITGSANRLTFTGSCAAVHVNGSKNELKIAQVGQITVTGSFNKVTWSSGNPKTSNTGQGNTIAKG
jgi:Protein of unknown function (DUF3060)